MKNDFPKAVRACLWSYDVTQIDMGNAVHRRRVIENILNRGTSSAVAWLFENISRTEIRDAIRHSSSSSWNKKSLSLWSLVFGTVPARTARFI